MYVNLWYWLLCIFSISHRKLNYLNFTLSHKLYAHFLVGRISPIQNINSILILFPIARLYKFLLHFDVKSAEEINSLWNGSRLYIHSYAKLIIFNVKYNKSYKEARSSFCQSTIKADRFPCQSLALYSISGN